MEKQKTNEALSISRQEIEQHGYIKLAHFSEIATAISRSNTIEETLQAVMQHIGEIFAPECWSLMLKDKQDDSLTFAIAIGEGSEDLIGNRLQPGEGIAGWIASNKQSVIIDDVNTDPRFSQRMDDLTGMQTQSIIGVPLLSGNTVYGVIELINKKANSFSQFDLDILTTIAGFAAIAIEKSYYYKTLQKLAGSDPLTQLHNKKSFSSFLDFQLQLKQDHNTPATIMLIDIDKFRILNDTWGHEAGDKVLISASSIIKQYLSESDKACRYEADEFILILPHKNSEYCQQLKSDIIQHLIEQNQNAGPGQATPRYDLSIVYCELEDITEKDLIALLRYKIDREKDRKEQAETEHVNKHLNNML